MKHLRISMLPSLFTLGNLACGFLAIAYVADSLTMTNAAADQRLVLACWLFFLAMVFDALDGKVARLTRTGSDFGGQLDSLADVVTFGLAPSFLLKVVFEEYGKYGSKFSWAVAALFVCCAALRLARFNVENTSHEESGHKHFTGLPTPAATGAIGALVILYLWLGKPSWMVFFMPGACVALSALMVSPIPYVHMGTRLLRGRRSFPELAQVVFVLFALVLAPQVAIAALFLGYALSGPLLVLSRQAAPMTRRLLRRQAS